MRLARLIALLLGLAIVAVWLPLLAAGLASLRFRGRLGQSDSLIVTGPYAHVRHPLYAGLSMTAVGSGLILGVWQLVMAGLGWLLITWLWSIPEDKRLAARFDAEYEPYRQTTPAFLPRLRWRRNTVPGPR